MFNGLGIQAVLNGVDVVGNTQCKSCNKIITFYGYIPTTFFCPNCGQQIKMEVTVIQQRNKYDKNGKRLFNEE